MEVHARPLSVLGLSRRTVRHWPEEGGMLFIRPLAELSATDGDQIVVPAHDADRDLLTRPALEGRNELDECQRLGTDPPTLDDFAGATGSRSSTARGRR
jgi:hypothetical protein